MGEVAPSPEAWFGEGLGHAGEPELGESIEHRMVAFHSPTQ